MRRSLAEEFNDPMRIETKTLTADEQAQIKQIKILGATFFNYVVSLVEAEGDNRNLALARTKIEEAVMWATKGVS